MSKYTMQSTVSSQPPRQICTHFRLFCSPPARESRLSGYSWRSQIPRTNSQWRGKCFHLMTSSCSWSINTMAAEDMETQGAKASTATSTIFDARHQWWEARVKIFECWKILIISSLCRVKCKLYLKSKTHGERDYKMSLKKSIWICPLQNDDNICNQALMC